MVSVSQNHGLRRKSFFFYWYFILGEQWRSSKDGDEQSWAAAATVGQPNLWDFWCWNTWRKSVQTWRDTDRPVLTGDWTHNLLAVRQLCSPLCHIIHLKTGPFHQLHIFYLYVMKPSRLYMLSFTVYHHLLREKMLKQNFIPLLWHFCFI